MIKKLQCLLAGGALAAGLIAMAIATPAHAGATFGDVITIHEKITVKGSAAALFARFGGWCAIPEWVPPVLDCVATKGSGEVGSLRVLEIAGLGQVEEIVAVKTLNSYTYIMTEGALTAAQYRSTISMVPGSTANTADVHWKTTILPSAFPDGGVGVAMALSGIYQDSLATLKAIAEK